MRANRLLIKEVKGIHVSLRTVEEGVIFGFDNKPGVAGDSLHPGSHPSILETMTQYSPHLHRFKKRAFRSSCHMQIAAKTDSDARRVPPIRIVTQDRKKHVGRVIGD